MPIPDLHIGGAFTCPASGTAPSSGMLLSWKHLSDKA
jgi:hypothetical protein